MSRAMEHNRDHDAVPLESAACRRVATDDWAARGGPLPTRLAAHVAGCPDCAEMVRRVSHVHASLMLLRTQAAPADLNARANARALRMLRRAARASTAARRLLQMRPDLSRWQRTQIQVARLSLTAAAAVMMLVLRTGTLMGFEQTRLLTEQLAAAHWDRHIDPQGEFLGPRALT